MKGQSKAFESANHWAETTFKQDILEVNELATHLNNLETQVFQALEKHKLQGKTITINVKYANFKQVTRSRTLETPITSLSAAQALIPNLLATTDAGKTPPPCWFYGQ